MPELTDLSYVRALCEKYDFALSKGFGQNFIVNPGLPPKIVVGIYQFTSRLSQF